MPHLRSGHRLRHHKDSAQPPRKTRANDLRGLFHLCGSGETTWAAFASEIFTMSIEGRDKRTAVIQIPTADYPTPARRPANSRLDTGKLARIYQIRLPDWQVSLSTCLVCLSEETGHE
jgi:dTDP-4-dehydrorhamnose reductase